MKKTLIALAALSAIGAFAQSSVTMSGTVDLGAQFIDYKGNGGVVTAGAQNGSSTSGLTIAGTEDLGGGMKAGFQWDMSVDFSNTTARTSGTTANGTTSNVGTYLGNGNSFISLGGNFGTVKIGTPNLSTFNANGLGNSGFGTAIGSGYRVTSFDAVRLQNALRFESASFSGFSGTAHIVTRNNVQANKDNTAAANNVNQLMGRDGATELGLAYNNGPVAVQYARMNMTQDASSNPVLISYLISDTVTTSSGFTAVGGTFVMDTLGASFTQNAIKVGAFYQRMSSDGLLKANASGVGAAVKYERNTWGLSAAYQLNPALSLKANYQRTTLLDGDTSTTVAAGDSRETSVIGLGVDYALSKRTSIYARYERDQDSAALRSTTGFPTAGAAGNTTYTASMIGVRHTF